MTHRLRAEHDAILVGIGTILQDDPRLTCRLPEPPRQPVRVVLDTHLRLPTGARLFDDVSLSPVWVLCVTPAPERKAALEGRGARIHALPDLKPPTVCAFLEREGLSSVLVEGGSGILTSFFQSDCFDRLVITITPTLLGSGLPAIRFPSPTGASDLRRFPGAQWRIEGEDVVLDWSRG